MYAKAQSQKYRNRSGKKREELPKCNLRGHDADRGYWRDWKAYCTMQSHSMRKHREAERNIRSDWERDLAALEWDIRYTEWDTRNLRDDICELNADIQCLEYQLSDVELLRDRLENLRKNRDLSEKYLRNSEEFLRKYMWVKEML